jgi:hypothetical protein
MCLVHIVGWYGELSGARSGNGFGPNPIAYAEIYAWARLTRRELLPLEIALLRAIDTSFLRITGEWTSQRSRASR